MLREWKTSRHTVSVNGFGPVRLPLACDSGHSNSACHALSSSLSPHPCRHSVFVQLGLTSRARSIAPPPFGLQSLQQPSTLPPLLLFLQNPRPTNLLPFLPFLLIPSHHPLSYPREFFHRIPLLSSPATSSLVVSADSHASCRSLRYALGEPLHHVGCNSGDRPHA